MSVPPRPPLAKIRVLRNTGRFEGSRILANGQDHRPQDAFQLVPGWVHKNLSNEWVDKQVAYEWLAIPPSAWTRAEETALPRQSLDPMDSPCRKRSSDGVVIVRARVGKGKGAPRDDGGVAAAAATATMPVAKVSELIAAVRAFTTKGESAKVAVRAVLSLLRSDDVFRRVCGAMVVQTAGRTTRGTLATPEVRDALRKNAVRDESREWSVNGVRTMRKPSKPPSDEERASGSWRDMRDEGVVAALRALYYLAPDRDDRSEEATTGEVATGEVAIDVAEEEAQASFLDTLRGLLLPAAVAPPCFAKRPPPRLSDMGRREAAQLLAYCSDDGIMVNALLSSSDEPTAIGATEGVRNDRCVAKRVKLLTSPSVALRRAAGASLERVSASQLGTIQRRLAAVLGESGERSTYSTYSKVTAAVLLARYARAPQAALAVDVAALVRDARDGDGDAAVRLQCKQCLESCGKND